MLPGTLRWRVFQPHKSAMEGTIEMGDMTFTAENNAHRGGYRAMTRSRATPQRSKRLVAMCKVPSLVPDHLLSS